MDIVREASLMQAREEEERQLAKAIAASTVGYVAEPGLVKTAGLAKIFQELTDEEQQLANVIAASKFEANNTEAMQIEKAIVSSVLGTGSLNILARPAVLT